MLLKVFYLKFLVRFTFRKEHVGDPELSPKRNIQKEYFTIRNSI
jgi:hypothetical protein